MNQWALLSFAGGLIVLHFGFGVVPAWIGAALLTLTAFLLLGKARRVFVARISAFLLTVGLLLGWLGGWLGGWFGAWLTALLSIACVSALLLTVSTYCRTKEMTEASERFSALSLYYAIAQIVYVFLRELLKKPELADGMIVLLSAVVVLIIFRLGQTFLSLRRAPSDA
ncbi:MAG: hypothetical protein RR135_01590 [Oscillospiraceae bacterium]